MASVDSSLSSMTPQHGRVPTPGHLLFLHITSPQSVQAWA